MVRGSGSVAALTLSTPRETYTDMPHLLTVPLVMPRRPRAGHTRKPSTIRSLSDCWNVAPLMAAEPAPSVRFPTTTGVNVVLPLTLSTLPPRRSQMAKWIWRCKCCIDCGEEPTETEAARAFLNHYTKNHHDTDPIAAWNTALREGV